MHFFAHSKNSRIPELVPVSHVVLNVSQTGTERELKGADGEPATT